MGVEFKDLTEQIELLKKRKLKIDDEEKTKNLLLCSNYYDLVNGYSRFLKVSSDSDEFYSEATFDELYSIYIYDKNIKNVFFKKIVKAEAIMRSYIAYVFSQKYTKKYDYLNTNNFRAEHLEVANLVSKLSRIIKSQSKHNNAIRHYVKKYGDVPLWVLVNFLEFGILEDFFKLMKDSDRNQVSKNISNFINNEYEKNTYIVLPEQIDSYLRNIRLVRNVIAHDNRLITYSCQKHMAQNEYLFEPYGIVATGSRDKVYHVYIVLKLFLSKEQFNNFTNNLVNETKNLDNDLSKNNHPINASTILTSMGFPVDWHKQV